MTTLPLFWHLSSATKRDRIDASVKLINALEQFQSCLVQKGPLVHSDADDATQKIDALDVLNAPDVSYSLRRLVRGLASPRESSRLGFAVALTELLSRITTVTCVQIIGMMIDGTKVQGSMSGQEERDVLFARLFGFTSIIQSGLLVRSEALPSAVTEASSLSAFEQVIRELLALGEKKAWLRESSWWTIGLALNAVHNSNVAWKSRAIEFLLNHLFVNYQTWSPEKVAVTLQMQEKYPSYAWSKYLCPPFKNPLLLHSNNLQILARILKESSTHDDDNEDQARTSTGSWKPDLHYVWDIILDYYMPKSSVQDSDNNFQEFYQIVVDESLFSSASSPERKYWGFQVFKRALPRVTQTTMPMLFTKNFMRCWINHLSNQDRYLHKIARQAALEVQSFVQQNPQLGFSLILQLTGSHGHQQFDKLTKTKTVDSILSAMDELGVKNYVDYLYSQFNGSEEIDSSNTAAIEPKRGWIIDQLGALVHNHSVPKSDEWVTSVLDWLTLHGLFAVKKKSRKTSFRALHSLPQPPLSQELSSISYYRLMTCLGDLCSQPVVARTGEKSLTAAGVASDGELWMAKVFKTITKLEGDAKHVEIRVQLSPETRGLLEKARKLLSHLQAIKSNAIAKGAETLLLATLLRSYSGARERAQDLEACIDGVSRLFCPESRIEVEAPEPIDILVDLIIGFMEDSTSYLRAIGNQAFALLSGSVKRSTIDLILTQLERRDPAQLMHKRADDQNTSESSSESESESGIDENTLPAAEDGSEDGDEELMDDEQMVAIDDRLSNMFQSRINLKKKSVSAQREATHFKNRVLDLVDTFLKKQPSSPLTILLINPLIEILRMSSPDEQQLADKARGILRTRFCRSKDIPSNVDLDGVKSVLDAIHDQARKSPELLSSLSLCSLHLSRILVHCDAKDTLLSIYQRSLTDFLTRKNSALNSSFFREFIQRYASIAWELSDSLLDLSTKAVNTYRQCQAFHLIEVLLNSLHSLEEAEIDVVAFIPKLSQTMLGIVENACKDEISLSAAQLKELLKLMLSAIRQGKRHGAMYPESWNASTWATIRGKLQTSIRYKSSIGLVTMCDQIVQTSGLEEDGRTDGQKRKACPSVEDQGRSNVKRKKK